MEQPPPIPSASPGVAPADIPYYRVDGRRRIPASITVIAILAIIFGALALLCDVLGMIAATAAFTQAGFMTGPNLFSTPAMNIFRLMTTIVGLALAAALLAGGIGGVMVRPWARKLLMRWAILTLIFLTVACAIEVSFDVKTGPQATQTTINTRGGVTVVTYTYSAQHDAIVGFVSALLGSIFPTVVLLLWRRPAVVEEFNRIHSERAENR